MISKWYLQDCRQQIHFIVIIFYFAHAFQILANKLSKIKDSKKEELLLPDPITLSQIEKDENSFTKEELIDHNEAWKAVENDKLFIPEYTKFNSEHISKEATEGVALKMPIFFCVIKSMDLTSGHDINCELMDMKGILKYYII